MIFIYFLVFSAFTDLTTYTVQNFGIPAVPIIFVLAVVSIFLEMLTKKSYLINNYRETGVYVVNIFFLSYLTFGMLKADKDEVILGIYSLLICFFIFHLVILSVQKREELEGILLTILLTGPVLAFQGLYQFFQETSSFTFDNYFRAGGWWLGPNEYAFILNLVYVISFYFMEKERSLFRWTAYIAQLSILIGLLLSASRGGIIIFILISLFGWRSFRRHKVFFLSICLATGLLFLISINLLNINLESIPLERFFSSEGEDDLSNGRLIAALGGLLIWYQNPFVGVGFGNILEYGETFTNIGMYSHNMYIEIMATSGIVPLIAYLIMLCYLWRSMPKGDKSALNLGLVFRWFILALSVMGFFGHYILEMKPVWIMFALLLVFLRLQRREANEE